jgi:hypothetical protein
MQSNKVAQSFWQLAQRAHAPSLVFFGRCCRRCAVATADALGCLLLRCCAASGAVPAATWSHRVCAAGTSSEKVKCATAQCRVHAGRATVPLARGRRGRAPRRRHRAARRVVHFGRSSPQQAKPSPMQFEFTRLLACESTHSLCQQRTAHIRLHNARVVPGPTLHHSSHSSDASFTRCRHFSNLVTVCATQ